MNQSEIEMCQHCKLPWSDYNHIPDTECWERYTSHLQSRNAELEARVKELELQLTPQINKYEIGELSGGPGPGPLWSTQEIAKQVENEIQEG